MADLVAIFFEALVEGYLSGTGRWVLSLVGLKANPVVEAAFGLLIWIAGLVLMIAVLV